MMISYREDQSGSLLTPLNALSEVSLFFLPSGSTTIPLCFCPCLSVFELCSVVPDMPSEVQDGIVVMTVPCFFVHAVPCMSM